MYFGRKLKLYRGRNIRNMPALSQCMLTFYFFYKLIQQNVYIEILNDEKSATANTVYPRVVALGINFVNILITEKYLYTDTAKKVTISVYCSIITILLNSFKGFKIVEIIYIILNLTICEATIYCNYMRLWQMQLCLETSILVNYISIGTSLYINNVFAPIYALWILSILLLVNKNNLSSTSILSSTNSCTTDSCQLYVECPENIQKSCFRLQLKRFIYFIFQTCVFSLYIMTGCTTIRNNTYEIFTNSTYPSTYNILLICTICVITAISSLILRLKRELKLIFVGIIVFFNYIINIIIANHYVDRYFYTDIILKKVLSLCKCCLGSFLLKNSEKIAYSGTSFRILKFIIINADNISYLVNVVISTNANVNYLNIYVILTTIMFYISFTLI